MLLSQKRQNNENSIHLFQMSKKMRMDHSLLESDYVEMPWDDKKQIIIQKDGVKKTYSRWELVKNSLQNSNILSIDDFVAIIKSYNVIFEKDGNQSKPNWKCLVLHKYVENLDEFHKNQFFKNNGVLCSIKSLALQLEDLVPKLKLLKSGNSNSIKLHQMQIASILASAFFCTFPKGKTDCPSINFNLLYESNHGSDSWNSIEKLKCIIHYFERIYKRQPTGNLSFHRLCIPDHKFPRWDKINTGLCSLHVDDEGKIEDQEQHLQMDFANKYIGGGVLGRGCVQEEIRFVICPELIASRLFTECLEDNESLLIIGAERYCQYTGYSSTFKFAGDFQDSTPFDENRQRKTYIIALDALYFSKSSEQFRESRILREIKKAYVGFKPVDGTLNLPVATGNWGCGAFKGDPQLKCILQLIAASQARRDVLYLTFGDSELKNRIQELYQFLIEKSINIGTLYRIIRLYNRERRKNQTVFEFVKESVRKHEKRKSFQKTNIYPRPNFTSEKTPQSPNKSEKSKIQKETHEEFPNLNIDFDALDKDIQKQVSRSGCANNVEHTNVLDVIWYENEVSCASSTCKKNYEKKVEKAGVSPNFPSLLSEDDMEVVGAQGGSNMSQTYENSVFFQGKKASDQSIIEKNKCVDGIESLKPTGEKPNKKFIQPKITDLIKK